MPWTNTDQITANTAAGLALDAVEAAGHGHPGTAVALAPAAQLLFSQHLRHDPKDPNWEGRDRFVLSCGHASMLLYAQLHLSGYHVTLEDLQQFRKTGSKTPGHPEYGHTPGVEMTTGPLGQGLATAVGMAWSRKHLSARFDPGQSNSPLLTRVYVIASDGDLEEGITSEASSFAGLHALNNLIVIYDDNKISIDGDASASFKEDIFTRYQAYGWNSVTIDNQQDGSIDISKLDQALTEAKTSLKPTLIQLKTIIAWPSPNMQGKASTHGSPMGKTETELTKAALGLNPEIQFQISKEALTQKERSAERAKILRNEFDVSFKMFQERQPKLAKHYQDLGKLSFDALNLPKFESGSSIATRKASQQVLESISALNEIVGGSADLSESNGVAVKSLEIYHGADQKHGSTSGRRLLFGIREHMMGAFINGIALASSLRAFSATFLIFSDYMKPAIRLACLMRLPVIWVFSHDSIGLGEDGPTHQPVEQLWSLRAIPGISVVRPADANETAACWIESLRRAGPTAMVLTRQNVPTITDNPPVKHGAYVLHETGDEISAVVIATGSEVSLALAAAQELANDKISIRVVSAPCLEWFDEQTTKYQESVLGIDIPRVSVEAGSTLGWHRYIGGMGTTIGVNNFGASATPDYLFELNGVTVANIVKSVKDLLKA